MGFLKVCGDSGGGLAIDRRGWGPDGKVAYEYVLRLVALALEVQIVPYRIFLVAGEEDDGHVELAPAFLFDGEGGFCLL